MIAMSSGLMSLPALLMIDELSLGLALLLASTILESDQFVIRKKKLAS